MADATLYGPCGERLALSIPEIPIPEIPSIPDLLKLLGLTLPLVEMPVICPLAQEQAEAAAASAAT